MPQQQEQGPCMVVFGIVLMAVGFLWWWPIMVFGGFLFIMGICMITQEANKAKTQTTDQPAAQPVAQPAPQPVAQPAPAPIIEAHRFCPHCGAQTTGKYCTTCGSEID